MYFSTKLQKNHLIHEKTKFWVFSGTDGRWQFSHEHSQNLKLEFYYIYNIYIIYIIIIL